MKYLGWISLLSVPVGIALGILIAYVIYSDRDTSGLAGLGPVLTCEAIIFIASVIGLITGVWAILTRSSIIPGIIGVTICLLIVGVGLRYFWFTPMMQDKADRIQQEEKERAEKAIYEASPDIESSGITTLLESPHLKVEINDIAVLPGGKILVYFDIDGGRSGSKIVVFSAGGKPDTGFSFEKDEKIGFHRKRLLAAPNGDFLLVSTDMYGPDSFDRFGGCWTEEGPALVRNLNGKLTDRAIVDSGGVKVVRFAQSGELYGIDWISPSYGYVDTDKGEVKKEESKIEINLMEMPFKGKKFRCKAALEPALSNWMHNHNKEVLSPDDLFFWPNGDIGLILSSYGDTYVHRIDPTGKRVLSSIKTGSESFSDPNHCVGFFPDGSLVLEVNHTRESIAQYRNGKKVTSFSKIVEKLREHIDIQATVVTSDGELVLAGNPRGKKHSIQFVIIDSTGKERNGFLLGKDR